MCDQSHLHKIPAQYRNGKYSEEDFVYFCDFGHPLEWDIYMGVPVRLRTLTFSTFSKSGAYIPYPVSDVVSPRVPSVLLDSLRTRPLTILGSDPTINRKFNGGVLYSRSVKMMELASAPHTDNVNQRSPLWERKYFSDSPQPHYFYVGLKEFCPELLGPACTIFGGENEEPEFTTCHQGFIDEKSFDWFIC